MGRGTALVLTLLALSLGAALPPNHIATPVVGYYFRGSGLCDQLYFLVHTLVFAKFLRADVQLPSFFYHTERGVTFKEIRWINTSWNAVLNLSNMNAYWNARGVNLIEGPIPRPVEKFQLRLSGGLTEWMREAEKALSAAAQRNVTPHLVYPFWLMNVGDDPLVVTAFFEVTRSIQFTDRLRGIADRIIARLQGQAAEAFVGVHLRVERDFLYHPGLRKDLVHMQKCHKGARHCLEKLYVPAFLGAGLSNSSPPMYVASGLFNAERELLPIILPRLAQFSSSVQYNLLHLTAEEYISLVPEQLAAIDLQVLTVAAPCFGMGISTFSHFINERKRVLNLSSRVIFVRRLGRLKGLYMFGKD